MKAKLRKNSNFEIALLVFMISLVSANLSASPLHHMDASDCATQTSCNNCFISASIDFLALNVAPSFCGKLLKTVKIFESYKLVPTTPPPKN